MTNPTTTKAARAAAVEALRGVLTRYTKEAPPHSNGLCWWLSITAPDLRQAPMIVKASPPWKDRGSIFYVDRETGPTPARQEFAQHMISQLDAGLLVPALGGTTRWLLCRSVESAQATTTLIDLLHNYVVNRPQHLKGLCSYAHSCGVPIYVLSKLLLDGPLRGHFEIYGNGFVDPDFGPTYMRVRFAELMLERLAWSGAELLSLETGACRVD